MFYLVTVFLLAQNSVTFHFLFSVHSMSTLTCNKASFPQFPQNTIHQGCCECVANVSWGFGKQWGATSQKCTEAHLRQNSSQLSAILLSLIPTPFPYQDPSPRHLSNSALPPAILWAMSPLFFSLSDSPPNTPNSHSFLLLRSLTFSLSHSFPGGPSFVIFLQSQWLMSLLF